MPELPEVENVRRTLHPRILGRQIRRVELLRADIVEGGARPADLLEGATLAGTGRRGKQLAVLAEDGRCMVVHLGMTGRLNVDPEGNQIAAHTHAIWRLSDGTKITFADPRRFGSIRTHPSAAALDQCWSETLGPDAMEVSVDHLRAALKKTKRAIKAALLDQALLAGLGNIYVDELLFRIGVHPLRAAAGLKEGTLHGLVGEMKALLQEAVDSGGSSLRDYVDAEGKPGYYQTRHQVYGRAGLPCLRCSATLRPLLVAGRTTVACPRCQPLRGGQARSVGRRV